MTPPPGQSDRLGICNVVGIFMLAVAVVAAMIISIDAVHRSHIDLDESRQLVRAFGLNRLCLVPSGRALRISGLQNDAIDWRYDPRIARIQPDPAILVLQARD